ncbi:MAG: Nramp family divalent metal transporter [Patescibacteria group bacterium]
MIRKDLSVPPKLSAIFGPSFILLGLALGSGELILWPYLSANYGLGLIWGAVLGITFQFFLNLEIMRYSLVWGESVFLGFRRLWKGWPIWFILSTFIPWSLPGFSSAAAEIIAHVFGLSDSLLLAIGLLLLTGLILTLGRTLYRTMELLQRGIIFLGLPLILLLTLVLAGWGDWTSLTLGVLGIGNGWLLFPAGVSLISFLGAFAYSGAGGNLNLAQSYYVKEKGFGMGRYGGKISSLFVGGKQKMLLEGTTFVPNSKNLRRFHSWWRLLNWEHFLVFWGLGLLTIILLSVLATSLVFGQSVNQGISFLYQEAIVIGSRLGSVLALFFLLVAALMLYSTQIGVLESSSRIISENWLLLSWWKGKRINASLGFYLALWGQIGLGIVLLLLGIKEPRFLLTLSAVLNAVAMMILFPLVWFLNRKRLDQRLQAGWFRQLILLVAFIFFVGFCLLTLASVF